MNDRFQRIYLRKIVHACLENALVFVAGDVFGDLGGAAFTVGHFSEDAAAGGGEPFDGKVGAVGVVGFGHGWISVGVAVLEDDLTVLGEFLQEGLGGDETTFAVGDGKAVEVADLGVFKPGGVGVGDAGGDVSGDVASDAVVGESGRFGAGGDDFSVR